MHIAGAFLCASTMMAQDAQVTQLMLKDLADFPGKEGISGNQRTTHAT